MGRGIISQFCSKTMEVKLQILCEYTCRICLENYETSNSLLDEVAIEEGIALKELLERVMKHKIHMSAEGMDLPSRICLQCTDKLFAAYEFVARVQKSEQVIFKCRPKKTLIKIPEFDELSQLNEFEYLDDEVEAVPSVNHTTNSELVEPEMDVETLEMAEEEESEETVELELCTTEEDNDEKMSEELIEAVEKHSVESEEEPHHELLEEPHLECVKEPRSGNDNIGSRLRTNDRTLHYQCKECARGFARKETLDRHMRNAHTNLSPEELEAIAPKPTAQSPVKCCHCPRIFMRQDLLRRHLLAMHKDSIDLTDAEFQPPSRPQTGKRGLCPHCGDRFSAAGLLIHIRRHTGDNPYKCNECDKAFPRRQDLVLHTRSHTGEKPHICTVCGKSFIRPNKLNRHMRIHTGLRPYKCTQCGKSFAQSNDLKIHMRRHSGEKPYQCGICGSGFITGTQLKMHRKRMEHYEPDQQVDPFEKCRVRSRVMKQQVIKLNDTVITTTPD